MKRLIARALVVVVLALTGCGRETPSGLAVGIGTLYQYGGECGATWILRADSGRAYELTSLAAEFHESGLRVRFTLKRRSDVTSTCMIGEAADVVSMTKL